MLDIKIRLEENADHKEVEAVARAAFYREERIKEIGVGCAEPYMIHELRKKDGIQELNLVAVVGDQIVGHIIYSHSYILKEDGIKVETLNMGPLSVLPAYQKQGVGSALMRDSLKRARKLGYGAVIFFGHPEYYPRFGLVEAKEFHVTTRWGKNYPSFMAMELQEGYLKEAAGRYIEADIYDEEITGGPAKKYEEKALKLGKRVLLLYGVNCTKSVWNRLQPYFSEYEVDVVEYPHEITQKAEGVSDLTKWVYDTYRNRSYDVVIGHSLGGIVALQLAALYQMRFEKIIYLDTNLKPANEFYRNLMTPEHMEQYGSEISSMFKEERKFYTRQLFEKLQGNFDYTKELSKIDQKVYALYGNRNHLEAKSKIADLNLSDAELEHLEIRFVPDCCHMIMVENPKGLFEMIEEII